MPQPRPFAAVLVAGAVLALSVPAASHAADGSGADGSAVSGAVPQVETSGKALKTIQPLSGGDIEGFMTSVPEVRIWADGQDDATRTMTERRFDAETLAAEPFGVGLERIQGTHAYADLAAIVRRHGFTGPTHWASTADRVIRALAALQMEKSGPTPDQLDETRRQVINNPNLTAAEKEQILASVGMATAMRTAPEDDLLAVGPYAEQLAEALGHEE